jgi:hypothetical protein
LEEITFWFGLKVSVLDFAKVEALKIDERIKYLKWRQNNGR